MLSWGIDPPRFSPDSQVASWRLWLAQRIAIHLVRARKAGLVMAEAISYVEDRMALEGIQTKTWVPCDDVQFNGIELAQ
jgi:hypothetical protein